MKKYLIFALLLFLIGCGNSSKELSLKILHINDTHSHLEPTEIKIKLDSKYTYVYAGGYAKLSKFIKETKNSNTNTLVLHAGDAVQGTLYYILFKGKAGIEALNKMEIDAMCVGNHEFDNGANSFAEYFASKANFPILSCDIDASRNKILKNIIKPYIIKNFEGERVAVVGDTINSSIISNPGPTIIFLNYIKSSKKYVNELKNMGINKIIFLTHIGYEKDKFLAKEIPDIDIIVGGHSHTLLGNFSNLGIKSDGPYPTIIEHNTSKTLIVTDYKWGEMIGNLDVVFDKEGRIKSYKGNPILLVEDKFLRKINGKKVEVNNDEKEKIEQFISNQPNIKIEKDDLEIVKVINRYKPEIDKLLKEVIAKANEDLINVRLPGDDYEGKIFEHGSMIAPVVAKAMYEKVKKEGCDFAIENAGAVRTSIFKGDISIGDVYNILPFGNTLVIVNLKGEDIKTTIENAIERSLIQKTNTGAFPYLYNAKITIDKSRPFKERIVEFKIKENGNWVDLDKNRIYKIVVNSYIAAGGDYYTKIKNADKTDTGFLSAESFIEYARKAKIVEKLPEDEIPVIVK